MTGNVFPWALVALAFVLLVVGSVIIRNVRHAKGWWGALALAGFLAALLIVAPTPPAHATCLTPSNSLTIVQTSVNTGLSPTQAPSLISGRVTNNGPDETEVRTVTVTIGSITKAPGAAAGVCDSSDYIILDPVMPVGVRLVANGGGVNFSGARIGFLGKSTIQDPCKGAVLELRFASD